MYRLLSHPNIVKICDVEVERERWLFVKEPTTLSLREFRQKEIKNTNAQSLDQKELVIIHRIAKDVALGLHHLHTANCPHCIVHLNLHPDTIYSSPVTYYFSFRLFFFWSLTYTAH